MMFGQYCRIESKAGGVGCTRREFIRACLSMVKKTSRYSREFREMRHQWIKSGLDMRNDARREYCEVIQGNFRPPTITRAEQDAMIRRSMYHA